LIWKKFYFRYRDVFFINYRDIIVYQFTKFDNIIITHTFYLLKYFIKVSWSLETCCITGNSKLLQYNILSDKWNQNKK